MRFYIIVGSTLWMTACSQVSEDRTSGHAEPVKIKANADSARRSIEQLRNGLSRSAQGLSVERLADGTTKVHLNERFQSAFVTSHGGASCIDSPASLDELLGATH